MQPKNGVQGNPAPYSMLSERPVRSRWAISVKSLRDTSMGSKLNLSTLGVV